MKSSTHAGRQIETQQSDPVGAFQMTMRTMVGIAARSLAQLEGGQVSIAQFRLLAVLDERGPLPSSQAAAALGLGASSVTRLADRLEATGYLTRTRGRETEAWSASRSHHWAARWSSV